MNCGLGAIAALACAVPGTAVAADPPAHGRATFYVAPRGDDASNGTRNRPFRTLARAQQAVREKTSRMHRDLVVNLGDGTYALPAPLEMDARDSGRNGHAVVYRAEPGAHPILSGGRTITGWTLADPARNIWKAAAPGLTTRQLFVNGRRATRARGLEQASFTQTATGYTIDDPSIATWAHPEDAEIVSRVRWRDYRCGIAAVQGNEIRMQEPCWTNSQLEGSWIGFGAPSWVENAYELLDQPGEWYLDRHAGELYYIPRAGEDLSAAAVVAPVLEQLVDVKGTVDAPLSNVRFEGLTFADTTWLAPDEDTGFAEVQAGTRLVDPSWAGWLGLKPDAALELTGARHVTFAGDRFTRLGAAGVDFGRGSAHNAIVHSRFDDIGSNGIEVGSVFAEDHHPSDPRTALDDHLIQDNVITRIGVEDTGAVAIFLGYTAHTVIDHNTIHDLPYTGISSGWGWGSTDPGGNPLYPDNGGQPVYDTPTTAHDNRITNNDIYDYMKLMADGAGIYTLGAQPRTVVSGNYVHDMRGTDYAALYPDEGTRYITWEDDVVANVPRWAHVWTPSIRSNVMRRIYSDTARATLNAPDNEIDPPILVTDGNWPAPARAIMANAGER
jgi:hypothetical protein